MTALHRDLLTQARALAHREPKRPRQASLRRAVSTAYYALFHLLIDAASRELVSKKAVDPLRDRVARAFSHSDMKKLCRSLAVWNPNQPPTPLSELLDKPPSADLVSIAGAFIELQQARHEADYDVARRFVRDDVDAFVDMVEEAFAAFTRLEQTDERRIFLMALAFHDRWKRV